MKYKGDDYDLHACLEHNLSDDDGLIIKDILATIPGENDGPSWHWIVSFENGKFAYITGGCDYTGWDCQSSAQFYIGSDLLDVLSHTPNEDYDNRGVTDMLLEQLKTAKHV